MRNFPNYLRDDGVPFNLTAAYEYRQCPDIQSHSGH